MAPLNGEVGRGSVGKDLAQEPGHAAVAGLAPWKFVVFRSREPQTKRLESKYLY